MNVDYFLDALGNVKPEYIEEAEFGNLPRLRSRQTGGKIGRGKNARPFRAFAAGAAAVLVVGTSLHLYLIEVQKSKNSSYESIDYNEAAQLEPEDIAEKSEDGAGGFKTEAENEDTSAGKGTFFKAGLTELKEYYGIDLMPEKLPADLQYQSGCETAFGFFYGEDKEPVSDVNTLVFENESGGRKILLGYSKIIKLAANDGEMSAIDGQEVFLKHCPKEDGTELYQAEFEKDGIYCLLIGEGMTKEEIIDILKGLIAR